MGQVKAGGSVLVIDDSRAIRAAIKKTLRTSEHVGEVFEAEDGLTGLVIMRREKPDVVLCDGVMPRLDGLGFLRTVKQCSEFADTPVILLTSQADTDKKVEYFDHGANDYVTKPFAGPELIARINLQLRLKAAHDQLKAKTEKYWEWAVTDPLTTLYNRRYFTDVAEKEWERSERYNQPLALILLDIDHFKKVNDTFGHSRGDEILQLLGGILQESVRSHDVSARLGGEEFAVLLPMATMENALCVAERLRTTMKNSELDWLEGRRVTISLGVSAQPVTRFESFQEMLDRTDQALYAAKTSGRDCTKGIEAEGYIDGASVNCSSCEDTFLRS